MEMRRFDDQIAQSIFELLDRCDDRMVQSVDIVITEQNWLDLHSTRGLQREGRR